MAEWRRGWRIVLGAAIGSGLGMPLFYYVFSLFTIGITTEFNASRGDMANVQALLVVGALVAPFIGRALDRHGFAMIFGICSVAVITAHILTATWVNTLWQFALVSFIYGVAGVGCGPLAYTRPINAWFWDHRGLALGMAALGIATSAAIAPPLLADLVETHGWRAGFWALAIVSGLVGLPLALMLVRNAPPEGPAGLVDPAQPIATDRHFFRERDFWLLCGAMICMAMPGAGLISQLSPLIQEEGVGARMAAFAVTAYAVGQVGGRIIAGWFLDRVRPQIVAFSFTFVPALGFILLWSMNLSAWAAIVAVGMVGVQQGAEIDLFAFFTSRRFGLARYGTVYGWIITASWLGNGVGIISFGQLHDVTGNYSLAELIAAGLMMIGAVLIALVRIDRPVTVSLHSAPGHLPTP